jgi:hypothetical protein
VSHNYGGTIGTFGGVEDASGRWSAYRGGAETGRYSSTWRMAYSAYAVDWCTRQGLWTISSSVNGFVTRIVNWHIQMNIQNTQFLSGKSGLSHPYYLAINTTSGGVVTKWLNYVR